VSNATDDGYAGVGCTDLLNPRENRPICVIKTQTYDNDYHLKYSLYSNIALLCANPLELGANVTEHAHQKSSQNLAACRTWVVLLRQQGIGLFFRSFSLNSHHYSPQMIKKIASIPHLPRYEPHKSDRLLTRMLHEG
jgi:hypothetical protein